MIIAEELYVFTLHYQDEGVEVVRVGRVFIHASGRPVQLKAPSATLSVCLSRAIITNHLLILWQ